MTYARRRKVAIRRVRETGGLTAERAAEIVTHNRAATRVDAVARDNFLASLDGLTAVEAFANLRADAESYGWNPATRNAIAQGITERFTTKGDA